LSILIAVLIFGLLIVAHELGHFLVAKRVGIKVHEFSIGMGPVIFARQKGETLYSLRAFPIGGFNRMAGMESGDTNDPRGFAAKSVWQRMAVVASGSLMNFALAILLFIAVFMVIGTPSNSTVIGGVLPDRPAAVAGLLPGDRVVAVNGQKVATWMELVSKIHQNPGKEIQLQVLRGEDQLLVKVTPQLDPHAQVGMIGIEQAWHREGLFSSIVLGVRQALFVAVLILESLVQMVTGRVPAEVAGPVGIVQMVGEAARLGIASVLSFAGLLSLNLGLINLFPVPALDGSRLVFLAFEKVRGRPVDPERENFIHLVGFALLILLMLIITYKDILRIFG